MPRRGERKHLHLAPPGGARGSAEGMAEVTIAALEHLADASRGCDRCRDVLGEYPLAAIAKRAGGRYREAIESALADVRGLDVQLQEADRLIQDLVELDVDAGEAHILSNPRYWTMGMVLRLLEYSEAVVDGRAPEALGLAKMAVCIAESLPEDGSKRSRFVQDLRGMARSELAAVLRTLGRLDEAAEELARAESYITQGTGTWVVAGRVVLERCRWLLTRGEGERARRMARQVEHKAERGGDQEQAWDGMLVVARARRVSGELLDAITELRVLVAATRSGNAHPEVEARCRLELVAALYEAGELDSARQQLARLRLLDTLMAVRHVPARASWWSGMVEADADRTDRAVDELERAWRSLAADGLGLEALGAGLALASLYVQDERWDELGALGEALPDLLTIEGMPGWAVGMLLAALDGIWQRDGAGLDEAIGVILQAVWFGLPSSQEPTRH
jgi:tetratricopeptide (TPR) repeat protein